MKAAIRFHEENTVPLHLFACKKDEPMEITSATKEQLSEIVCNAIQMAQASTQASSGGNVQRGMSPFYTPAPVLKRNDVKFAGFEDSSSKWVHLYLNIQSLYILHTSSLYKNKFNPAGSSRSGKPWNSFELDMLLSVGNILLQTQRQVTIDTISEVISDNGGDMKDIFGDRPPNRIELKARELLKLPPR